MNIQIMILKTQKQFILLGFILVLFWQNHYAQTLVEGSFQTINASGSYEDYTIPTGTEGLSLILYLRGADGGKRDYSVGTVKGGQGALATARFPIGYGANELNPGGTIRFIVGVRGNNNGDNNSFRGGGGGGGTGVLYTTNPSSALVSVSISQASSRWILLGVAGGGGGASWKSTGVSTYCSDPGSPGNNSQAGTPAGNNSGGTNGGGGDYNGSTDIDGGAGGGYLSKGDDVANSDSDRAGKKGGVTGGAGGTGLVGGGFGYGGGGAGMKTGGGGGGYSGGGGGDDCDYSGGGGGSYISSAALESNIVQNSTTGGPNSGYITYAIGNFTTQGVVAKCQDITVNLNNDGYVKVVPEQAENGSLTTPGEETFLLFVSSVFSTSLEFDCIDIGVHSLDLLVFSGTYVDQCAFNLTVTDNKAPEVSCVTAPILIELTPDQDYTLTAAEVETSSSDNCGQIANKWLSQDLFTCTDVINGVSSVTLYIEDNSGNVGECAADVTVTDKSLTMACFPDFSVALDPGECDFLFYEGSLDPDVSNNCRNPSLSHTVNRIEGGTIESVASGMGFMGSISLTAGVYQVFWNAIDLEGNTANCSFQVTVIDPSPDPLSANCPANVSVSTDAGTCSYINTDYLPTFGGDCFSSINYAVQPPDGQPIIMPSSLDGFSFEPGVSTVTAEVFDDEGASVSCSFVITVEDTEDPNLNCLEDAVLSLDNTGQIVFNPADFFSYSDNCGVQEALADDPKTYTCDDIGKEIETFEVAVVDLSGNVANCVITVSVEDNEKPTADCKDITVALDASGQYLLTPPEIEGGGSFDNCGTAAPIRLNGERELALDCSRIGENTVQLVIGDGNTNRGTCEAKVVVTDVSAPIPDVAELPVLRGDCSVTLDESPTATDACAGVIEGQTTDPLFYEEPGTYAVRWSFIDNDNNESTQMQTVIIEDLTPPTAICQDITIYLDEIGDYSLAPAEIDGGSADACGIALTSTSRTDFDCSTVGSTVSVELFVEDDNNNRASCLANVTVENTPLAALCRDVDVYLDENGEASVTPQQVYDGADPCGIAILSLSQTDFNCSPQGAQTVVLTVSDGMGSSSTCEATVTVIDNLPPALICKDIVVKLDKNGSAVYFPEKILVSVTDNCVGIDRPSASQFASCEDIGVYSRTITLVDGAGNEASCTKTITITDDRPPEVLTKNISLPLDEFGQGVLTAAQIDDRTNDNCSLDQLLVSPSVFDCSHIGLNIVTLTAIDAFGNSASQTAEVTVIDNTTPVALCRDLVVPLDAAGNASITAAAVDNGSNDACGIASVVLSQTAFSCDDLGDNTVVLTVTDHQGVENTCTATVAVEDPIVPQVELAANAKLWPPDYGYQTFTVDQMITGLSDNCGVPEIGEVFIVKATSDEAEDDPGTQDGNTLNDIVIASDCRSLQLRRERMGGGNGRVYTVTLAIPDESGNTAYADYQITIPKWAWGWNSEAEDDGAVYIVDGQCQTAGASSSSSFAREAVPTRSFPSLVANKLEEKLNVYPNPFEEETTVAFYLPVSATVSLEIFNIHGQRVRRWPTQKLEAGEHQLKWNGGNDSGQRLDSGLYLLRMKADEKILTRKVSLQKK